MELCMERLRDHWVVVQGQPMFARVSNTPPRHGEVPVVLVHGLVVSSRYMAPLAGQLSPYFRVYTPDLPGFGQSPAPGRVLNVPELSDTLIAWMDAMGLERAAFVANSFGCQVVADLAARHPERATRVVLIGPSIDPWKPTIHEQTWRLFWAGLASPPILWYIAARDFLRAGLFRTLGTTLFSLRYPSLVTLKEVLAPTLVLVSDRDPFGPQAWRSEVVQSLSRGVLCTLPGLSHALHFTAPGAVAPLVVSFLRGGFEPRAPEMTCRRVTLARVALQSLAEGARQVRWLSVELRRLRWYQKNEGKSSDFEGVRSAPRGMVRPLS